MTTRPIGSLFSVFPAEGRGRRSSLGRFSAWRAACAVFLLCAATAIAAPAQTFNTLAKFNGNYGALPQQMSLVQGIDGNFYGTASYLGEGLKPAGTFFEITPGGTLTAPYSFCAQLNCYDGYYPRAPLVLDTKGNFYGTTSYSDLISTDHPGTFFEITPEGVLTPLHDFNATEGLHPDGALVLATDGNFYGTAAFGGVHGYGTVFKITPEGDLTKLYDFDSFPHGAIPVAGLVQAIDGNFYGTTYWGGAYGGGTIFKITPGGTLTTLYSFCAQTKCTDGNHTWATLVQATDGNFYGTTVAGGSTSTCPVSGGCGTVFKITPDGLKTTTLYSFCTEPNCAYGGVPLAGLIQATDGEFYGTTTVGGTYGDGTIFTITPEGAPASLHSFDGADGLGPYGALFQATNGTFYGTTRQGGDLTCLPPNGCGTVFSLPLGLHPFVSLLGSPAKVGQTLGILGQGFTEDSSVFINGTPLTLTSNSDNFLTATVPNGATSGRVTVITPPSAMLISNVPFRVTPQLSSFSPTSGAVGTQVTITGVSLTQTIGVGFGDGVPADFTVNSDSQVTATVPTGAKTGRIRIRTRGGLAVSTDTFTVTP